MNAHESENYLSISHEDLLNIKRKGDTKSRTLSRTSDNTETRNPCVISNFASLFYLYCYFQTVLSDVRERVRDLVSPLRFMLRRSSLVECVSVLHGMCLQCAEKKYKCLYNIDSCELQNFLCLIKTIISQLSTVMSYCAIW
jgi:hypothetical protein